MHYIIWVGKAFLFNHLRLVRCDGAVDTNSKNEYSQINSEQIVEVGLAESLNYIYE